MAIKTVLLACFLSVAVAVPEQSARTGKFDSFLNDLDEVDASKITLRQDYQRQDYQDYDILPEDLQNDISKTTTTTTQVPILRQFENQNPDGSYSYGFESADGTYKIETRYKTGEVKGKYAYYDPTGRLREVEYGAAPERGFEPTAEGLIVAPPTISDGSDYDYDPEPVVARPQPARTARPTQRAQPAQPAQPTRFANFQPAPVQNSRAIQPARKSVKIIRRPAASRSVIPQQTRSQARAATQSVIPQQTRSQARHFPQRRPTPQPAVPQQQRSQLRHFPQRRPTQQPAIPQRAVFQQPAAPQQIRFQQPATQQQVRFQPRQLAQPAVQQQNRFTPGLGIGSQAVQQGPLPSSVSFFNHPYISDYNSANGVFSYSY